MGDRPVLPLRTMLILVFLVSVAVPAILVMAVMPSAYSAMVAGERRGLTDTIGSLINKYLDDYLDAMERETIIPYFSPDFARALRDRQEIRSPGDQLARKRNDDLMMQVLQNAMGVYRNDIVSTVLVTSDLQGFAVSRKWGGAMVRPSFPLAATDWYRRALAADGRAVFVSPHTQDYLDEATVPLVFSVARLIRDPNTRQALGVIMVDQNTKGIDRVLGDLDLGLASIFVVTDQNSNVLYGSQEVPVAVRTALARDPALSGRLADWEVVSRGNQRSGWRIHILLSRAGLDLRTTGIYLIGILFILGNLVVGLSAFAALSKRITDPVARVMAGLRQVETGDLGVRIEPAGVRESRELGQAINSMLGRLQRLIQDEYQAKLSLKEAEYQALQAQLQPHFLYNVLYCLQGLNQLGERAALDAAIFDLHDMLRYSLEPGLWTTLGQEAAFLGHYCTLQKLRFQERLGFSFEISDPAAAIRIPRLLLQPLVENAIIHGIEPLSRPCRLAMRARIDEVEGKSRLICTVEDDGKGFDPANCRPEGHGLGLDLVRQRLANSCPGSSWKIDSQADKGTKVTLEIPL